MCAGREWRYSDSLRVERYWDRNQLVARFSAPFHTDPGAHLVFCILGMGSIPRVNGRGVALNTHPYVAPRLKKE